MVIGPVTVGVRPSLPVWGVALILGNDLAGQRVTYQCPLYLYLPVQLLKQ